MLNAVFYSTKESLFRFKDLEYHFKTNGICFFMATSPRNLYNIINCDTKLIIFDDEVRDEWLEFSINRRIGKTCEFLYLNNFGIFDFETNKKIEKLNLKTFYMDANALLAHNSEYYAFEIKKLLDELGIVSYKLNSIILSRILLKMLTRNITMLKDYDLSIICDDLGFDVFSTSKKLTEFVKNWFYKNKEYVGVNYPIFRAFEGANIKNFLSIFMFCLYDKIFKQDDDFMAKNFNFKEQIKMFDADV